MPHLYLQPSQVGCACCLGQVSLFCLRSAAHSASTPWEACPPYHHQLAPLQAAGDVNHMGTALPGPWPSHHFGTAQDSPWQADGQASPSCTWAGGQSEPSSCRAQACAEGGHLPDGFWRGDPATCVKKVGLCPRLAGSRPLGKESPDGPQARSPCWQQGLKQLGMVTLGSLTTGVGLAPEEAVEMR